MSRSPRALALKSVEESAYEALRERIVCADIPPGAHLHLRTVADELGVSTMPVRGALARLTVEGLAVSLPRRGAIVAPLSAAEFEELQDLRRGIEGIAARVGVAAISNEAISQMRKILGDMRANPHTLDEYLDLEWQAYLLLYGAADRARTVRLILEYSRLTERYVRFAIGPEFDVDSATHYLALLIEACDRRDADAAQDAIAKYMNLHLDIVKDALVEKSGEVSA